LSNIAIINYDRLGGEAVVLPRDFGLRFGESDHVLLRKPRDTPRSSRAADKLLMFLGA